MTLMEAVRQEPGGERGRDRGRGGEGERGNRETGAGSVWIHSCWKGFGAKENREMGFGLERVFLLVVLAWLGFRLRRERLEHVCADGNCQRTGGTWWRVCEGQGAAGWPSAGSRDWGAWPAQVRAGRPGWGRGRGKLPMEWFSLRIRRGEDRERAL